jgi:hypothetical protein
MPGSSHDVDPSFMDTLALSIREPALDLIRFSSLKELLTIRLDGPSQLLKEQYPTLTREHWNQLLNAVILTKVSYFQVQLHFPNRYIDKLIEITAFAYGMKGESIGELYQALIHDHSQMAAWIKNALLVQQQNIKYAQRNP